jgi:mRNA-degrading endonuclease toxin of MazEF toxin-antitoxin module
MVVKRFDVFLINLDPTIGSEIRKTRPCLIRPLAKVTLTECKSQCFSG